MFLYVELSLFLTYNLVDEKLLIMSPHNWIPNLEIHQMSTDRSFRTRRKLIIEIGNRPICREP